MREADAHPAQIRNERVLLRHTRGRSLPCMRGTRTITGTSVQGEHPLWTPLLDLVGEDLTEWFMWMYEVRLADGSRVDAYKHCATRRYLHLGADGRVFTYDGDDRYREIDPQVAVDLVLAGWHPDDGPFLRAPPS
jgi:hypothetical protein